ncbi:hypothetical protein CC85DRAFT_99376 [Cutaneotrichosporon oleaginosum]|uniref:Uncharacterized protein n=1 Tax=Cutaneotrichosporon oleaginosum TaxID=879819 RepID=A0A0J1B3B3_9TREE|nr:uncharacterized protein CC85DRAFT_99376 [Cutaneotrichosporon oleaginosum]KLT42109.1 hypothetical protein CC85DRAFT_99376 [Cutaneotrichosporon oleaginosum]TXT04652.1 hypothetical protein COLE_07471 [Cutaneotrichosporon oleaginosum]
MTVDLSDATDDRDVPKCSATDGPHELATQPADEVSEPVPADLATSEPAAPMPSDPQQTPHPTSLPVNDTRMAPAFHAGPYKAITSAPPALDPPARPHGTVSCATPLSQPPSSSTALTLAAPFGARGAFVAPTMAAGAFVAPTMGAWRPSPLNLANPWYGQQYSHWAAPYPHHVASGSGAVYTQGLGLQMNCYPQAYQSLSSSNTRNGQTTRPSASTAAIPSSVPDSNDCTECAETIAGLRSEIDSLRDEVDALRLDISCERRTHRSRSRGEQYEKAAHAETRKALQREVAAHAHTQAALKHELAAHTKSEVEGRRGREALDLLHKERAAHEQTRSELYEARVQNEELRATSTRQQTAQLISQLKMAEGRLREELVRRQVTEDDLRRRLAAAHQFNPPPKRPGGKGWGA